MEFMITFIFWVNVGIVALFTFAVVLSTIQAYKAQKLKNVEFDVAKYVEEELTKQVEKEDN